MANYISFQPSDKFNTLLYTGNASTNAITGVGFAPAFSWFKSHSNTNSHAIFNTLEGTYSISPNGTAARYNASGDGFTSLDSDGFTFNGTGGGGGTNGNGFGYVSWNWAGGTTTVPSGSTATVSACNINVAAGQGVYKYQSNQTGNYINHGLGKIPQIVMVKNSSLAGTDWAVYTSRNESVIANNGDYWLKLNGTAARANSAGYWNDTVTTDTRITLANGDPVGGSGYDHIMFAFCNVNGYQRAGGYNGNNNVDGPFVYTGFKPAYVMIKNAHGVEAWNVWDNRRNTPAGSKNPDYTVLQPNNNTANNSGGPQKIDMLSNGFKIRTTSTEVNADGAGHIYLAIAEKPIVSSNNVPGTAR